jgi:23S rRNA C2498 (ribose-2'-O)-methylase RlmM
MRLRHAVLQPWEIGQEDFVGCSEVANHACFTEGVPRCVLLTEQPDGLLCKLDEKGNHVGGGLLSKLEINDRQAVEEENRCRQTNGVALPDAGTSPVAPGKNVPRSQ